MLCSLALPERYLSLLSRKGFETRGEIAETDPSDLAKELSIPNEVALKIWKTAKYGDDTNKKDTGLKTLTSARSDVSALQMLRKKSQQRPIFSLCAELDMMLGSGIQMGEVTEFCGVPGVGKTQLGTQLACTVQIPKLLGGTEGKAVYIDTEGSFMPRRAMQIAKGVCEHLVAIASARNESKLLLAAKSITPEQILKNIFCFRAYDHNEQLLCVENLTKFLKENSQVKLVVLDSVAFHFRHGFSDNYKIRNSKLKRMETILQSIARENEMAVVLMNQVTTRLSTMSTDLVPALGPTWAHACTNRIMLGWKGNTRIATLVKSPSNAEKTIEYEVVGVGIRDVGYDEKS